MERHPDLTSQGTRQAARVALALALVLLAAVVATPSAQAQTFTMLHEFAGASEGANPVAGLVQDAAGNLYGTSSEGGVIGGTCQIVAGCGVVFKLDPVGTFTVLYRFTGGADGANPMAGLVLDTAGNLYGTTSGGGSSGSGTVFELDPATSKFTVLHSHGSVAGLVMDAMGNLYGSTSEGIFKLDPATDTFTVLDPSAASAATLARDAMGNLYGTTSGTVFKWDTTTGMLTVLHTFTGKADGGDLRAGVILDPAGNLYGTASSGGALNCLGGQNNKVGCGLVYELSPVGVEREFNFTAGGDFPVAGLVRDTAGNLYGTTEFTGPRADSIGLVFKMDANGGETALFHFADGSLARAGLVAGLILDSAGNLYGTTEFGGFFGAGTVFKLDPTGPANFALTVAPAGNGTGTVTGNPPGIDCPSSCMAFFTPGIAVTLTAAAAAGSIFAGWSGPCSGTGVCHLTTTNSAEVVFATFNLPPADFSLSASTLAPGMVSPGGSSTSTVSLAPTNGFSGNVALTCAVTPSPALTPTCSISPSSIAPGTPATLTVSTTGPTPAVASFSAGSGLFYAFCLPLIGLVATWVGTGGDREGRKGNLKVTALACMLFAGLVFQAACGGSSNPGGGGGTPKGTYTITVTGTDASASLMHSTPTALTVQ